jgi:hypothetical protein
MQPRCAEGARSKKCDKEEAGFSKTGWVDYLFFRNAKKFLLSLNPKLISLPHFLDLRSECGCKPHDFGALLAAETGSPLAPL